MPTVKETYRKRQREISRQIKKLQSYLKKYSEEFKKNDTNWGFVGDLSRLKSDLSELNQSIKPTGR